MVGEIILAHLVGDYLLQSHHMATRKTSSWLWASVHGALYTLPFLFITQSPVALLIIAVTHAIIDRYRLARHVGFVKNLVGPWKQTWEPAGSNPIDGFKAKWRGPVTWEDCKATGYPSETPVWMSVWLMIITDNTLHLLINFGAVLWT